MKHKFILAILIIGLFLAGCRSEPEIIPPTTTPEPTAILTSTPTQIPSPTSTPTQEWCSQADLDAYWEVMIEVDNKVAEASVNMSYLFEELDTNGFGGDYYALLQEVKFWEAQELLEENSPPPCAREFHEMYLDAVEHYSNATVMISNYIIGQPDIEIEDFTLELAEGKELYDRSIEMLFELFEIP